MDSSKLKTYDTLLNPTFNRLHGPSLESSPATLCLALIALVGVANAPDVRTWLHVRASKDLKIIKFIDSSAWERTITSSNRYLSKTPETHLEMLCERVIGRFLTSPPGPQRVLPDKEQKLKIGLVAVAMRLIESLRAPEPRDSILLSSAALAIDIGTTRVTAHKLIHDMVGHGYLNRVSSRPGSASRFRIPATTKTERITLDQLGSNEYESLRDSLLNRGLLAQVNHPAFGYTGAGHKPWLMAVSMLAGTGPESVGLRRRQDVPKLRIAVDEMGLLSTDSHELAEGFATWSVIFGGEDKYAAAMEKRQQEIESRRAEIGLAKDAASNARESAAKALGKMEEAVGRMPSGRSKMPTLEAWAAKSRAWLEDVFERFPDTRAYAQATAWELERRAARLGWSEDTRRLLVLG